MSFIDGSIPPTLNDEFWNLGSFAESLPGANIVGDGCVAIRNTHNGLLSFDGGVLLLKAKPSTIFILKSSGDAVGVLSNI